MNVDQPLGVGLNQRLGHNPHPTGHDHQVDLGRLEAGHQRLIQLLPGPIEPMVQQLGLNPETLGPLQGPCVRVVDEQELDLGAKATRLAGLNQGLEIAAGSGGHHPQAELSLGDDGLRWWQRPLDGQITPARVGKSGVLAMSHLSILPTVLQDERLLAQALEELGYTVHWGGHLQGFADQREPVSLWVQVTPEQQLGWMRHSDGSLALVGDLQRIGRSHSVQQLVGQITRTYAALRALEAAATELSSASVELIS